MTPQTGTGDEEDGEIEWEKVDTDELEREAIASTPGSSQRTDQEGTMTLGRSEAGTTFGERLRGAAEDGPGKRKREEEINGKTPKQANDHEAIYLVCDRVPS